LPSFGDIKRFLHSAQADTPPTVEKTGRGKFFMGKSLGSYALYPATIKILFCVCLARARRRDSYRIRGTVLSAATGVAYMPNMEGETITNKSYQLKRNLMMKTQKLKFNRNYAGFCKAFLKPFDEDYDACRVINRFWQKYTLQEAMLNLYQVLLKGKKGDKEYPLFKEEADKFINEMVALAVAHYFYFQDGFTHEHVDIPLNKSFNGVIYPGRKGFIDELYAVFESDKVAPTT